MPSARQPGVPADTTFLPGRLEDVFAVYLARELNDPSHVRAYARLTAEHSMCFLVNALRRARAAAGRERVGPEDLFQAIADLRISEVTL